MTLRNTNITEADILRRALEIADYSTATADDAFAQAKAEAEEMDDALDPWRLRRRIRIRRRHRPSRDVMDHDRWRARPSDS